MIYITGDTHADFSRFDNFCAENKITEKDIVILLGDAGINYYGSKKDDKTKKEVAKYPLTFFCIYGNHEKRPSRIVGYKTKEFHGGMVWYDENYPNQLFAEDGEIYDFDGRECMVIGGAYSVDKDFRLLYRHPWYYDEQPSAETKALVEKKLRDRGGMIDVILSHTCPRKYIPTEVLLDCYDPAKIDRSTEDWLDKIEDEFIYRYWFCGHYHTDKKIDRMRFYYESIAAFDA